MKSEAKERVYLLIIVFCLLMCAVLIASVLTGRPVFVSGRSIHRPQLREQAAQLSSKEGYTVTEDMLAEKLSEYLPDAAEAAAEIRGTGEVSMSAGISKKALRELLKQAGAPTGAKYKLAMLLLPSEVTLRAEMQCGSATGREIDIRSCALWINDKSVSAEFTDTAKRVAGSALMAALGGAGEFHSIAFSDGAITVK